MSEEREPWKWEREKKEWKEAGMAQTGVGVNRKQHFFLLGYYLAKGTGGCNAEMSSFHHDFSWGQRMCEGSS